MHYLVGNDGVSPLAGSSCEVAFISESADRVRKAANSSSKAVAMIDERDIKIQWYSGTGAGGQYRNKHQNSCRLVHIPTGIQALGTKNRERAANLRDAMQSLEDRVAAASEIKKERRNDQAVVRTYHFERNEVIDYASGLRRPVADVLNGHIDEFVTHPNRGHRPRHTGRT